MNKRLVVLLASVGSLIISIGAFELFSAYNNQPELGIVISKTSVFSLPMYNSTITFAQNGRCGNAYYENYSTVENFWAFSDLYLGNQSFKLSYPTSRWLEVSAHTCNITILGYDQTGESIGTGWLNYTVLGSGNQTLNFGGSPQNISVTIDGSLRAQNDGWMLNKNGDHIIITGAKSKVEIAYSVFIPVPA